MLCYHYTRRNDHYTISTEDDKGASALSLELAGKIVTLPDCGVEDLLKVIDVD
jgi:hypothetical protein